MQPGRFSPVTEEGKRDAKPKGAMTTSQGDHQPSRRCSDGRTAHRPILLLTAPIWRQSAGTGPGPSTRDSRISRLKRYLSHYAYSCSAFINLATPTLDFWPNALTVAHPVNLREIQFPRIYRTRLRLGEEGRMR